MPGPLQMKGLQADSETEGRMVEAWFCEMSGIDTFIVWEVFK